ncbi:unnamed protein product, partial [Closterium sp. Naga37s-1]
MGACSSCAVSPSIPLSSPLSPLLPPLSPPPPRYSPSCRSLGAAQVASVAQWCTFNIIMILVNNEIFQRYGFAFPLTLTAIHFALSFVGAFTAIEILQVCPKAEVEAGEMVAWVMPMAVVTCFNVVLGQLSLRYVPLPALLSTKALSPGLTVAIQALALQAEYDWRLCLSLLPVMAGAMLAYAPSVHFALPTFLSALCCVVLGCATVICAEVLLKGKQYSLDSLNAPPTLEKGSSLRLPSLIDLSLSSTLPSLSPLPLFSWFPASLPPPFRPFLFSSLSAVPAGAVLGAHSCATSSSAGGVAAVGVVHGSGQPWPAVIAILISGCFAFCLNFSLFYTIQKTSALTFNVAGNLKLVITLIFSWLLFRTPMAPISLLGCLLELVGVVCYGWAIFSMRKQQVELLRSPSAQVRVEQEASDDIVQVYLGAMLECKAAVVARLRNLDAAEWGMLWENAAAADEEEEEEPLEQVPHSAPFSLSSPMTGAAGAISARRSWAWREKMRSFGRQLMPRRGSCDDLNVAIATASVTPAKRAKSFPESKERGNEKGARRGRSRADSRGVWRSVYEPRWLEEGLAETSGDDERRPHGANRDEMGVRNDTAQRARESGFAGREGSARYQLLRHNSLPCACASQKVSPTLPRRASVMHGDSSAERSACSVAAAKDRPSSSSSSQHRRSPSLLVIPPFLPSCLPALAQCRSLAHCPLHAANPHPVLRGDSAAPSECSPTGGDAGVCSPADSNDSSGGRRNTGAKRADGRTSRRSPAEGWTLSSGTPTEGGQSSAKWRSASSRCSSSSSCPGAASHGAIRATAGDAVAVAEAGTGGRVRGRGRGPQLERGDSLHFGGNGGIAESAMRMGGEQADVIREKAVTMADAADAVASSEAAFKGDEALAGSAGAAEEMEEGAERGTDGGEAEGKGEGGQGGEGGEGEEGGGAGGEVPMPLRVYMLPLTGELNFHVLLVRPPATPQYCTAHTPFRLSSLSPVPMPPHAMRHCERPPYPPPPFLPRPPSPHTLPSISPFSPRPVNSNGGALRTGSSCSCSTACRRTG